MLLGRRVLVVEDQPIIAMGIGDMLRELGAEMIGPGATLEQSLHMARSETMDAAILDIWLGESPSYAVGDILEQRQIPFVLMSGADVRNDPESFMRAPRLPKPFTPAELARALSLLFQRST